MWAAADETVLEMNITNSIPSTAPNWFATRLLESVQSLDAQALSSPGNAFKPSPMTVSQVSSRTFDASLRIKEIVAGMNNKTAAEPVGQPPSIVNSTGFSAADIEKFEALGADAWVSVEVRQISDAELKKQIFDMLVSDGAGSLAGFDDAVKNGTLSIQRASDVPEAEIKEVNVTLYKGGYVFGGMGFGSANLEYFMNLRRNGTFASTAGINGNTAIVSWPMPWETDNFLLKTGIYASA